MPNPDTANPNAANPNAANPGKKKDLRPLVDKVIDALNNLLTLDIETKVVDSGAEKGITTRINLIDGDITNVFHKDYAGDPADLRKFHESQVAKSQEIIDKNIASLKALFEFAVENKIDK